MNLKEKFNWTLKAAERVLPSQWAKILTTFDSGNAIGLGWRTPTIQIGIRLHPTKEPITEERLRDIIENWCGAYYG